MSAPDGRGGPRVVRVIARLEPGGAQLSAYRLHSALEGHGITGAFLGGGDAAPEGLAVASEHGIAVEAFGGPGALQWEPSEAFAAWLAPRLAGADLVHAHMFGAWWAAAQVIPDGVPLVASEHNALHWPGRPHVRALRAALDRVDLLFAHGPAARAYLTALGLPPARLARGVSALPAADSRPRPGLPVPRIVLVGRLSPDKGPDVLVEALGRLDDPPPTFVLGTGALEPALRRRVRALGLESVVRFVGWQPDPSAWMAGASAVVVPSREEAGSQAALIAMRLGTPVVGSSAEALPAMLGDGRGIVFATEDPEALARALADLLAGRRRPDLAAARAYAAGLTPAEVAAAYARRYAELVTAGGAAARWTTFVAVTSSSSSGP